MIRRATAEDVDAIAKLYERSFALLDFLPMLHTLDEHRTWFGGLVERDEVWVYAEDGTVLGFSALSAGELDDLYLEPSAIGRGIGSALFRHATERRPDGFRFWVFQQNERARRFYEAHGCRPLEFTDGAHNEEKMPDVRYEWRAWPTAVTEPPAAASTESPAS
jgi:ribosomal protein S18 acetylase RimI-like enzyme